MDNMRVHLRRHPRNDERLKSGAASRARPDAKHSMKFNASTLHRPPVSSSWYLFSLSTRALSRTAPFTVEALGQAAPNDVTADLRVMSTANCAPWCIGRPDTRTSIDRSSTTGTDVLRSRSFTWVRTVPPASRHKRANVLSGAVARDFNLPDRGHAPR